MVTAAIGLALLLAGAAPGLAEPASRAASTVAESATEAAEDRRALPPSADTGQFLRRHAMLLALGFGLAGAGLGIVLLMVRRKE